MSAISASLINPSVQMIDPPNETQLATLVVDQPLANRVDNAAHSVPLLAVEGSNGTRNNESWKKRIELALVGLPPIAGVLSLLGCAKKEFENADSMNFENYICCDEIPNTRCHPSCTPHPYETWQKNVSELNTYGIVVAAVGIAGGCLSVYNVKALDENYSPTALKVISIADIVFGTGLIVLGTVVLPPTLTVLNPITIATGASFISAGSYLAVKSCGGARSLCSKVTSCFRKCLPW